ncbi:MAG: DNA polymerase III subunit delta' [Sterolibacterium sp.]|nr:DNA polymerase III subunit delta' [Sterolibacterium sp.]MBP9799153.1 DNA polymerase III subunit delta' [Sterolibacterium sp.]
MNIYPWQESLWQQLLGEARGLPHALLLTGDSGLGKFAFAQALAARLLCEQAVAATTIPQACGRCSACTWFAAGSHPDFRLVRPKSEEDAQASGGAAEEVAEGMSGGTSESVAKGGKGSKTGKSGKSDTKPAARLSQNIRIDQIRGLTDFVYTGSHRQGNRVILLEPAESMTTEAANSLLKMLEEPPPSVCFLMVSHAWRKLLPTIRSRCRTVALACPESELALPWLRSEGVAEAGSLLRLAGGAPLLARDWGSQGYLEWYRKVIAGLTEAATDPVAMAGQWGVLLKSAQDSGLPQLVAAIQKWVQDLVQLKLAGSVRYHVDWQIKLQAVAERAATPALLKYQTELLQIQRMARHPLNPQLFLEDMAARYIRAVAPVSAVSASR